MLLPLLAVPLGAYCARILQGRPPAPLLFIESLARRIMKFLGIDPGRGMGWQAYLRDLLIFHAIGFILLLAILLCQGWLPLNPAGIASMPWPVAVNTAISFITNTNWQAYAGEISLSYFSQMAGLTVQNFTSAAAGIAVMAALARGIKSRESDNLGNFGADMIRIILFILLPGSLVLALFLVSQGVIQNFNAPLTLGDISGWAGQILPMGPAASQIAIKQLGTNGGGFLSANAAHPFENPGPLSDFIQAFCILLLPAALPFAFGRMTGMKEHGRALFITMYVLFCIGLILMLQGEYQAPYAMEGKEQRIGIVGSMLWSASTTAASNGSVNAMLDSLSPLAGMIAMLHIMLGEIIFGGVGSGVYGLIIFVLITVFLSGLMVGRTPEYAGKKIGRTEITWSMIAALLPGLLILIFSALACMLPKPGTGNAGPHGLSEILYAFSSAAGNNGSAFGGLNVGMDFYLHCTSLAMLIGRFGVMIPVLAIGGSLAIKKYTPPSAGTFPVHTPLFIVLLCGILLIVGALTFFPALSLGPLAEHILMMNNTLF